MSKIQTNYTVYLLCFAHNPVGHAKHYVGSSCRLSSRIHEHELGRGHALTRILRQRGFDFVVSRLWSGLPNRNKEYAIKRGGGRSKICPLCNSRLAYLLPSLSEVYGDF